MYELEDHNVLRSAAFLDAVRYQPSPGRTRASGGYVGRNYLLNGYRQIFPVQTNPIDNRWTRRLSCRWAASISLPAMEEEFNDWSNPAYIPGYFAVPGLPWGPSLSRGRRAAEIPDRVRIRECRRARYA